MEYAFPIRLILIFPLMGFLLNIFFGRRLGNKTASFLSPVVILLSFVVASFGFFKLINMPEGHRVIIDNVYTWINVGDLKLDLSLRFDPLSIVMSLVVTGVGFLIHVYSVGYMHGDKRYTRYFAFLNLFILSMLILVLGNNLLLLFLGWEGVGLCSYLLIGFWFEKKENAIAAIKAFVVNRIGDFGFIIGIILLFWSLGKAGVWALDFDTIRYHVGFLDGRTVTIICLLLFMGATGKSAQIPLYVWLPDAMAGPTPVSALIHAATMVTAGIYMIARMSFLYNLSPVAMNIVAVVGCVTALVAATIALVQNDIKRVLAYSTISQLGYMFMAVGVGAYSAGIFHLATHAFFKALLFMGSGSVIHGMNGEQDMRKMGGLRKHMPLTWGTMFVATLAITGIPPFAGFFSKDEIIAGAYKNGHSYLTLVGLITAGLTAFYMFRLLFMTFWERKGEHSPHAHESPYVMIIPLLILAVLSAAGGIMGKFIHHFLEPVASFHLAAHAEHGESALIVISVLVALAGISCAIYFYVIKPDATEKIKSRFSLLYNLLLNKYYVDEIYNALFVRVLLFLNVILAKFDLKFIDGIVDGSGTITVHVSRSSGEFDLVFVDGAVNGLSDGVITAGQRMRKVQTGDLRNYLTIIVLGLLCLVIIFTIT